MWEPLSSSELVLGFLKLRKVQRAIVVVGILCFVLVVFSYMPSKRFIGVHSAISCKSKIAQVLVVDVTLILCLNILGLQIVMPLAGDREKYIESLGQDAIAIENDFFQ
jgi:hypothetical protein